MDLNPDSAAFYAKKEIARRNSLQAEGALKTGCVDLDTNVLLGGFERGTIVGVSAEDEEGAGILLALQTVVKAIYEGNVQKAMIITQHSQHMLLRILKGVTVAQLKNRTTGSVQTEKQCLQKILLSNIFDINGLWQVLTELDSPSVTDPVSWRENKQDDGPKSQIEDSDDDEEFSQSVQEPAILERPNVKLKSLENQKPKDLTLLKTAPDLIVITRFSGLLDGLFTQREKTKAHDLLLNVDSLLHRLARTLPSNPLIILTNSTVSNPESQVSMSSHNASLTDDSTHGNVYSDSILGLIANSISDASSKPSSDSNVGFYSNRQRPRFGQVFAQLLDLHLLCTNSLAPNMETKAGLSQQSSVEQHEICITEAIFDGLGVWTGNVGKRVSREQRWATMHVMKHQVT